MAPEPRRPLGFDLGRLDTRRWPVRTRIAAVAAAITFVILVAFALVVGRLVANQLTSDFSDEIRRGADEVASNVRVEPTWAGGRLLRIVDSPNLSEAMGEDFVVRVVDPQGTPLPGSRATPDLDAPRSEGTHRVDGYEVASQRILTSVPGGAIYVQYARSTTSLERTIGRLWLFLAGGVFVGTLLAALVARAVAGRAMRPITSLTAAAGEIAVTRDPSKRIPPPQSDDEVAELARILDQMLRELDAARSETEHMVQVQREFVADASHELRTPLTSVLANLELLQASLESGESNGDEAEIVDGALRSSRRMRWLVSDLLLLARADAGRTGVRRTCDITEIAASAREEVRAFASDHELSLDAGGPVPVEGNPEELHRLVLNLLENGVRHTPAGTEVRTAVARRDGEAVIEVTDDGPGLPEELGDQVFSRFVRGDGPADVAGDAGGTGLGLAIVKAVAESHGGTVEAGRGDAGGARFTIRLPLAGAPSPLAPAGSRG